MRFLGSLNILGVTINTEFLWDFMKDYENPENSWRIQRYLFRTTCFLKKIHLVPHSMHICSFCCWKPHAPHMQPLLLSPWPSYVAPAGRMASNVAATAGQEFPLPSCGPTMFPSISQTPPLQQSSESKMLLPPKLESSTSPI